MARRSPIIPVILGAALCGAAHADIYRSTDGGETWEFVGLPDTKVVELQFRPDDQRVMVARADDRLYESRDGGDTWTRLDDGSFSAQAAMGPRFSEFSTNPLDGDSILIDRHSPSVMWALAYSEDPPGESDEGIGLKRSEDGGVSWTTVESFPLPTAHLLAASLDMGRVFVAGVRTMLARPGSEMFATTDGGRTWERVGCCGTSGGGEARVMVPDPHDPLVLYAGLRGDSAPGGDGINYTHDGGQTWHRLHGFAPDIPHSFRRAAATAIVIDPVNTDVIYAATPAGVAKSEQRGEGTWEFHAVGETGWALHSLALDPFDRTHLLVAKGPNRDGVLWRSTDSGETWTHVEGALDGLDVQRIVFDPRHASVVFATTTAVPANATQDTGDGENPDDGTDDSDAGNDSGDTDAGNDSGDTDAGNDEGGTDSGNDAGDTDSGNDSGGNDSGGDDGGSDNGGQDTTPDDAPPPPPPATTTGGGGSVGWLFTLIVGATLPAATRMRGRRSRPRLDGRGS